MTAATTDTDMGPALGRHCSQCSTCINALIHTADVQGRYYNHLYVLDGETEARRGYWPALGNETSKCYNQDWTFEEYYIK